MAPWLVHGDLFNYLSRAAMWVFLSVDTAPESVHADLLNYLCRATDAADDDVNFNFVGMTSEFVCFLHGDWCQISVRRVLL